MNKSVNFPLSLSFGGYCFWKFKLHYCGSEFMFEFVMGIAAKSILSGLECLLEDVTSAMQNVNGTLSPIGIEDFGDGLNEQATTDGKVGTPAPLSFLFIHLLVFI